MCPIKLMVVEDDPVWMKCVCEYVEKEEDITVVKQAYTKEQAIQVNNEQVDIVLMDLSLTKDEADLSGIEVARKLYSKGMKKIIMLTSWEETDTILESFDIGAINYVTKTSYRDIPKAVRDAYEGKVSLHSDVSPILVKELKKERKIKVLTPTERDVYELKEKGLSRKQIAEKLYKSVETVKKQLKVIRSKIN
ncbi:LuxR family transcriptional regulator (plasmid) [Priestia filamentosa]|jgi:DNA-binding NarL/FixJ family response regulator|uniref:LuxR family transcriptional regulator n=3 Tax=Priestia TaxID=2800373 RepID=A0A2L1FFR6_9BACI|nr:MULTISPECIES: response regulator transcription factor [Priestia]AVD54591.1 DNA-binding response regulator [Priestia filamentosa]AWG44935.1 LuxR family transcriptional regulator [Priestia filamentosa]MBG9812457.1 LuxR family transcriptional regulator [Priestia endophytica]RAS76702.1 LuxR family transcriptional regulator [Priestia endophytica]